jgi:hypothetical protein
MSRHHYPPVTSETEFEELVCDLYNALHESDTFQLYKARGSKQFGIDIFSRPKGIVIQCKKKDPNRKDSELKTELAADLRECVSKAFGWQYDIRTFLFVTSTKKYGAIQDQAIELSTEFGFEVQFVAWPDIEKHISRYPQILERFYPHLNGRTPREKTANQSAINRLPIPNTIGANALMKSSIVERFNRLGNERMKRHGDTAFPVMYKKFKSDFKIGKNLKWTTIWDWPESASDTIRTYLDEKWSNTISGRKETARSKANYIPTQPQLFADEKRYLNMLGLEFKSEEVKQLLKQLFGVDSHTKISHSQHWLLALHLKSILANQGVE